MLSIVFTGINDNYGGNFQDRVFWHLGFNSKWLNHYGLEHEYIFVEWNPVINKPFLSETIKSNFPFVRCLVVDVEVNNYLSENRNIPLHEFFAKNVGARRSNGELVLFTNADLLFGKKTFEFLASATIGELDVIRNHRMTITNQEDILNHIIASDEGLELLENPQVWKNFDHAGGPPCTAASGDFTLVSRHLLNRVTGYDEKIKFASTHLDSRFLYRVYQMTQRFHVIDKGYHVDHNRSYYDRPALEWKKYDVERCINWNYTANLNTYNNGLNWGYVDLLDESNENGLTILKLKPEFKKVIRNFANRTPSIPPAFRCGPCS